MIEIKTIWEFEQWILSIGELYLYGAGNVCEKLLKKIEKNKGKSNFVRNIYL